MYIVLLIGEKSVSQSVCLCYMLTADFMTSSDTVICNYLFVVLLKCDNCILNKHQDSVYSKNPICTLKYGHKHYRHQFLSPC